LDASLKLTLLVGRAVGCLLEESSLSVDNERQELAGERILGGRVQAIADIDHRFPLGDSHEALECEANEACLHRHIKLIELVEPLGALA